MRARERLITVIYLHRGGVDGDLRSPQEGPTRAGRECESSLTNFAYTWKSSEFSFTYPVP